ncbi:MAG: 16S rRNA (cytidine(1402)-2'-O)-methyltransferase [Desulfovibrio sp.]|jgi:16S rRNA (cytidine1402-2'-O)-methyltransferase|nr:16S rRNA (cytidine(1402)-2'-O)-methyltransferase [Desulfovibrio sp.]
MPLISSRLWVVATPLGNPGDFSPRAREILAGVDAILAEDTRRAARLCAGHGILPRRLLSFFEHNEEKRTEEALRLLKEGRSLALISDAGTPLLADPGYRLVRACRRGGIAVSPLPGPSAPAAALSAAGIPPLPYTFLGFPPRDAAGRKALFTAFAAMPGSLVFFERRDRLRASLAVAREIFGPRELAICRELTKTHEEFILTRLERAAELPEELPGELTIIIGPPESVERPPEREIRRLIAAVPAEERRRLKPRELARRLRDTAPGWSVKEIYALMADKKN